MSADNKRAKASKEKTILRIQRGIQAAQLRITLDEVQGRQTPEAVVRLAQLTPPKLPSLCHVEDAGREAQDRSGVAESPGHARTPQYPGCAVEGRPGQGTWPGDSRSREKAGPVGASISEVKDLGAGVGTVVVPRARALARPLRQ